MVTIDRDVVSAHLMEPVVAIDASGDVAFTNERFLEIAQLERDEVVGADYGLLSTIVEDGFEAFVETVEAVARGELTEDRVELAMLHPETAPVPRRLPAEARVTPITEGGAVVGVLVVLRNISQRKRQEQALRRSERRFEAVLNSPDSFIGVLEPDGTVVEVNGAALDFAGAAPADVEGEPFWETPWWNHSAELQADLRDWISAAAAGEYVRFESTHVAPDGEEIHVDGVIRPVAGPDGDVVSLIAEGRDVTERRESEVALAQKNERLEALANVISHDLRNPLNVAAGRLRMVEQECDSEHLDSVAQAHERMSELIDDLLELARQGEPASDPEPVDLSSVARNCWGHVETADASLVVDADLTILADRSRLQQLLENLFGNAIRHGGDDVTVTIGARDGGFFVEDDGPGITADDREHVFELRYSTSEEGTGFGLNIVREIAEAHGWSVSLTEGTDGGARFAFGDVEAVQ